MQEAGVMVVVRVSGPPNCALPVAGVVWETTPVVRVRVAACPMSVMEGTGAEVEMPVLGWV